MICKFNKLKYDKFIGLTVVLPVVFFQNVNVRAHNLTYNYIIFDFFSVNSNVDYILLSCVEHD